MNSKEKPDFGTYHHSTSNESEKIRKKVRSLFIETFDALPFSRNDEIKILDVGCGLGFLSSVCAEYYQNAKVIGADTFEHASLKDSSLKKAGQNVRILGLSDRVTFLKKDVFRSNFAREKFNLLVSNLVFHNFGKKRVKAYERLAQWSSSKSYVILGDIFFDYKADFRSLSNLFGTVKKLPRSSMGLSYKILMLSEP
jgi:ribosomal protein L11 methylase PrmA